MTARPLTAAETAYIEAIDAHAVGYRAEAIAADADAVAVAAAVYARRAAAYDRYHDARGEYDHLLAEALALEETADAARGRADIAYDAAYAASVMWRVHERVARLCRDADSALESIRTIAEADGIAETDAETIADIIDGITAAASRLGRVYLLAYDASARDRDAADAAHVSACAPHREALQSALDAAADAETVLAEAIAALDAAEAEIDALETRYGTSGAIATLAAAAEAAS
jgi:hypothetical protein